MIEAERKVEESWDQHIMNMVMNPEYYDIQEALNITHSL